jgi:hypothetical protein
MSVSRRLFRANSRVPMTSTVRRIGSVVVLTAFVVLYVATRTMDDSSLPASPAPNRPAWTGAQVGFDKDGTPTIRMTDRDVSQARIACRREANLEVPVQGVLDAATAIPKLEQETRRTSLEMDTFVRSHPEHPLAPAVLDRYRRLNAAMRSARAEYTAAGERYNKLAHDYNTALEACVSGKLS